MNQNLLDFLNSKEKGAKMIETRLNNKHKHKKCVHKGDLDEDNRQKRKDFNNVRYTTLFGAVKFNFKKCKDLCATLTRMLEHMLEDRCC